MSNSSTLSLANFTGFAGRCGRLFAAPSKWCWKPRSSSTSTPDNMSQERISSAANDLRVMRSCMYMKTPTRSSWPVRRYQSGFFPAWLKWKPSICVDIMLRLTRPFATTRWALRGWCGFFGPDITCATPARIRSSGYRLPRHRRGCPADRRPAGVWRRRDGGGPSQTLRRIRLGFAHKRVPSDN
jgi:hypothetical protein